MRRVCKSLSFVHGRGCGGGGGVSGSGWRAGKNGVAASEIHSLWDETINIQTINIQCGQMTVWTDGSTLNSGEPRRHRVQAFTVSGSGKTAAAVDRYSADNRRSRWSRMVRLTRQTRSACPQTRITVALMWRKEPRWWGGVEEAAKAPARTRAAPDRPRTTTTVGQAGELPVSLFSSRMCDSILLRFLEPN